jgi:hypothetical protein
MSSQTKTVIRVLAGWALVTLLAVTAGPVYVPKYPAKELPFADAGPSRDSFVKGGVDSCSKKQLARPENKGIPAAAIKAFCLCSANSMADAVTKEETAYFDQYKAATASLVEKANAASQRCVLALAAPSPQGLPFVEPSAGRDFFVRYTSLTCIKEQQAAPEAKGLPAAAIEAFCSCSAGALADAVTMEEAKSLGQGKVTPGLAEKFKTASQRCVASANAAAAQNKKLP